MEHWREAAEAAPDDPSVLVGLAETGVFLSNVSGRPVADDVRNAIREGLPLSAGPDGDELVRYRLLTLESRLDE